MALELYFLNISLEILDISDKLEDVHGHIFVLFILSISACESAIGLALFLSLYSEKKASSLNDIKYLKG
jgi:NADH-quinone oxidoreductase subunit K